jgi:hypothetical protein
MRSILLALALLMTASETASAETFTVTIVNHRAIGTLAERSYGKPCSGGGDHTDIVQDTATYTCDSAGAHRYPSGRIYLFALVSPRGVQMCNLFWADRPWQDSSWGPMLPPGLDAEQQVSSGRSDDKTRPGCFAKQLGPDAYQVDTYVFSDWLGNEY